MHVATDQSTAPPQGAQLIRHAGGSGFTPYVPGAGVGNVRLPYQTSAPSTQGATPYNPFAATHVVTKTLVAPQPIRPREQAPSLPPQEPPGINPRLIQKVAAPRVAHPDPTDDINPKDLWERGPHDYCLEHNASPVTPDQHKLKALMDALRQTRAGDATYRELQSFNPVLCFDDGFPLPPKAGGLYRSSLRAMFVRRSLPFARQVAVVAHELRHAWQDKRGFFQTGIRFEDRLTMHFLYEADAKAFDRYVLFILDQISVQQGTAETHNYYVHDSLSRMTRGSAIINGRFAHHALGLAYDGWFETDDMAEFYSEFYGMSYAVTDNFGIRALDQVLPNILDLGHVPGVSAPGTTYLTQALLQQARAKAAEFSPRFISYMAR